VLGGLTGTPGIDRIEPFTRLRLPTVCHFRMDAYEFADVEDARRFPDHESLSALRGAGS
jgi:hypothetical protein